MWKAMGTGSNGVAATTVHVRSRPGAFGALGARVLSSGFALSAHAATSKCETPETP
jgi:hypothetical protein